MYNQFNNVNQSLLVLYCWGIITTTLIKKNIVITRHSRKDVNIVLGRTI